MQSVSSTLRFPINHEMTTEFGARVVSVFFDPRRLTLDKGESVLEEFMDDLKNRLSVLSKTLIL